MGQIRVALLRAAGTNCDEETAFAWERAGASADRVHVRALSQAPGKLDAYQILTIPGGFSYGDDIAAGRILAAQVERYLIDRLAAFVEAGKLVLGICNGFQVLARLGLVPGPLHSKAAVQRSGAAGAREIRATVTHNERPGFQDRWIWLQAAESPCVFLESGRRYELPIAHGEGRVLFRDNAVRNGVVRQRLNALRYVEPPNGDGDADEPANPNGSEAATAGLCDRTGQVFGLMPHPERFITWTQHPRWTSEPEREPGDGLAIFKRAVQFFA